jgi:hypothetical protein
MTQAVEHLLCEHLLCKCKALISNSSPIKGGNEGRETGREGGKEKDSLHWDNRKDGLRASQELTGPHLLQG